MNVTDASIVTGCERIVVHKGAILEKGKYKSISWAYALLIALENITAYGTLP